jgi:carboxyl-terminal processing protease
MKQRFAIILAFLISTTSVLRAAESYTNAYEAMALFTTVLEEVHRNYVDADTSGYDHLIRKALSGMLVTLDPYSQFLDEDEFQDIQDDTSGHFGGVGLVISIKKGMLTVISPMEDTPAFRAGILSGDVVLKVDDEETREMTLSDAVDRMRGEPGTDVILSIFRPSTRETREVPITRETINVDSVKDTRMVESDIGYIRITQFSSPTGSEMKDALNELVEQGMRGLVLDLRGNPGGLLTAAAEVAELFLPRGEMIVFTKGRNGESDPISFKSSGRTHYTSDDFPIVILINGGSASASEIVAGALQDHKRAMLIGEKSFGKGSVQSLLPLQDGSAIKLTTAKYYTPSERVIHDHGIEPDHEVPLDPETFYEIRMRASQAKQAEESDTIAAEEQEPLHDTQLEAAIGALKGMIISQQWAK